MYILCIPLAYQIAATKMKTLNLKIDQIDLKVLFLHSKDAYPGYTFDKWVNEVKTVYLRYFEKRENPKTYSEWINGQIIALTSY